MGYRLRFARGEQRRFLTEAKERNACNWKELAKVCGVDDASLWEYKEERRPLPEIVYQRMRWDNSFEKSIVSVKKSAGTQKHLRMPPKSAELAEFMGALIGDGHTSATNYEVIFSGHAVDDHDYLSKHIRQLGKRLFGLDGRVAYNNSPNHNGMFLKYSSKDVHSFLVSLGGAQGNKMEQFLEIPHWIVIDGKCLRAYLRGLYDTDGSIYRMSRRDSNLLRIGLKSYNPTLLFSVRDALRHLDFHPSRPTSGGMQIFLSRQSDVTRFLKEIGFANCKHKRRLEQFSPVV